VIREERASRPAGVSGTPQLDLPDSRVTGIVTYQRGGKATRYQRNEALMDGKHMEQTMIHLTQYQVILIT
jgi:hypothetical protein